MLHGCTRLGVCAFLLFCFAKAAHAELRIDVPHGNTQGWKIGYASSLKGCLAQATYNGDTTIWWGFTEDKGGDKIAFIALANPKWKSIDSDKTYELALRLRGQGNWKGKFFGIETKDGKGLVSDGLSRKFVIAFAEAGSVEFYVGRTRLVGLDLAGSRSALGAVFDCEKAQGSSADKKPSETSTGTGFIVSSWGHIVTNNHVVENCGQIEVSRVGERSVSARKIAGDGRNDLALLTAALSSTDIGNTVPALRPSARLGEEVYVFGFPLAGLLSKSGNFTSGTITALSGVDDDTTRYQISAPVQPGNSGGPLLDKYGNVVGAVVSKLNSANVAKAIGDIPQNVNFAIKSSIVTNFLESNGVKVNSGSTSKPLEAADIAEVATKYAVYIVCKSGPATTSPPVPSASNPQAKYNKMASLSPWCASAGSYIFQTNFFVWHPYGGGGNILQIDRTEIDGNTVVIVYGGGKSGLKFELVEERLLLVHPNNKREELKRCSSAEAAR